MARQLLTPLLPLFFTIISLISSIASSQETPVFLLRNCDLSIGNYTKDSPFHSNLLDAFSNLTSLSSFNDFSKSTQGTEDDATNKVYALYDCRNDLTLRRCHTCVEVAADKLLLDCSTKEATVMYEECMLRYANRPIFAEVELKPDYIACDISIPDGGELNRIVEPMIKGLINEATSENSSRYFGAQQKIYFEYQKVYSLVQCTPDLSKEQCKECLTEALNHTLECANASLMMSYYHVPSCQMRYDFLKFFNLSTSSLNSTSPMASPPILSPQLKTGHGGQRLISIENFVIVFFILFSLL